MLLFGPYWRKDGTKLGIKVRPEDAGAGNLPEPHHVAAPAPIGDDGNYERYALGDDSISGDNGHNYPSYPADVAPGKATPGTLADSYDLPRVHYRNDGVIFLTGLAVLFFAGRVAWRIVTTEPVSPVLVASWCLIALVTISQLAISLMDRPYIITGRQRQLAGRLVVVVIPVYNEDPALLDRSIWSLVNCSRPPDLIHIVEDGPSTDYSNLRRHWERFPCIRWEQLPVNQGKRRAHAHAFQAHPEADVFITVDSDTAVEYRGIEESLKPLADPSVMSVAFIEEIINKRANLLTWLSQSSSLVFQLTAWGAQSALGDLIVNRGTCALYRAEVIREIIPAYMNETFLGRPIRLGDDSALTLFSRAKGKTVQQLTAFSLPAYPESVNHHIRQRLRWARGGTLRNIWRIRYLSVFSYAWWWVATNIFMMFLSIGLIVTLSLTWPASKPSVPAIVEALAFSGLITAFRVLCVKRSGEPWWVMAVQFLMCPFAVLWRIVLLRFVRYYGVATFIKQGWKTRQAGPELTMHREIHGKEELRPGVTKA